MASEQAWEKIFEDYKIKEHDFKNSPFELTAEQIKRSCQNFRRNVDKEPRILCKQDTRNSRPQIFKDNELYILPKKNGIYYIIKGEGYIDIPDIETPIQTYYKKLDFELISSEVGDSEMQHLDYAYANSLIRTFMNDESLVLTIRGRKYTPPFKFVASGHQLNISSVQTEVDAGYEGKDKVVLIEAKNSANTDTIIRQLYYPYRQWQEQTNKIVYPLFFEKREINGEKIYYIWQFEFKDKNNYNSIRLVKSARYRILSKS